jgi:hypothetical protein
MQSFLRLFMQSVCRNIKVWQTFESLHMNCRQLKVWSQVFDQKPKSGVVYQFIDKSLPDFKSTHSPMTWSEGTVKFLGRSEMADGKNRGEETQGEWRLFGIARNTMRPPPNHAQPFFPRFLPPKPVFPHFLLEDEAGNSISSLWAA